MNSNVCEYVLSHEVLDHDEHTGGWTRQVGYNHLMTMNRHDKCWSKSCIEKSRYHIAFVRISVETGSGTAHFPSLSRHQCDILLLCPSDLWYLTYIANVLPLLILPRLVLFEHVNMHRVRAGKGVTELRKPVMY